MSTLSERGRDALTRAQKVAAGASVTYTRKADASAVTLTAIEAETTVHSGELPGRVQVGERDYILAVADLMVAGAEVKPQIGDRIAQTLNGSACVFEVMDPWPGEACWRYSSQWRSRYRVHTKKVS